MPKGTPHEWTLEELRRIDNPTESASALAREMGVARATIYGIKKQITDVGSVEELFEQMEERKKQRYRPYGRTKPKSPQTLEFALQRVYLLRTGAAGRGGKHPQVTVTIPGVIAYPFIESYGLEVMYEVREEGILIKPAPPKLEELPSWMRWTIGPPPVDQEGVK